MDASERTFHELMGDHVGFHLAPLVARHAAARGELTFHRAKRIQAGRPA